MPEAAVTLNPEQALVLGETPPAAAPRGGEIFVIIRMVLVLALAAAAIYGLVWFLRRSARPEAGSADPHLRILGSAHLGSNRFVYVVSVGARAWLVGAGEGGVNLISALEDQETVDAMLLEESRRASAGPASRFADFRALLRRLGGRSPAGTESGFSPEILRKQRERVREL